MAFQFKLSFHENLLDFTNQKFVDSQDGNPGARELFGCAQVSIVDAGRVLKIEADPFEQCQNVHEQVGRTLTRNQ